jgi:tRNA modification GTPase
LSTLRDVSGAVIDQVVAVRYDAPASFTGEHALELSTHGGVMVPTAAVAAAIARGARLAEPGEFTRRAVLNGKLDILQAEAVADLIAAGSRAAQRVALQQLDGGLSRRIAALRADLIGIEALIAYDIDFPEEDDGPIAPARTLAALQRVESALMGLLSTARGGELVREGALVVLAGAPNVGKSSLFNALLGRARAIVTPLPGTTRDALEAVIEAEPWPIRLVDTAGLRTTSDHIERIGIEVSESYVKSSAVVLCCGDDLPTLQASAESVRSIGPDGESERVLVLVRTKADLTLVDAADLQSLAAKCGAAAAVNVSAESGAGVQQLLTTIAEVLSRVRGELELDAPMLTQARHQHAVSYALEEVQHFRRAWSHDALPATIAAVHLHSAGEALRELIGGIDTEQVLDEVFRRFCVGK